MAHQTDNVPDMSFQDIREELLQAIADRTEDVSPAFLADHENNVPREVFVAKEELVEKLYIAADAEHRTSNRGQGVTQCRNHGGIVQACSACGTAAEHCGIHRRFRRAILGHSSERSCAKMLSLLLAVPGSTPVSETWERFLGHLDLGEGGGGTPNLFDGMLPFKETADVRVHFGDEFVEEMWNKQHEFCPVNLESSFNEKRGYLYGVIRNSEAHVECEIPDVDERGPTDWFYSDVELGEVILQQQSAIEDLYVEYYKYRYAAMCSQEPWARYRFEQDGTAQAAEFYRDITGPKPKIKIFTILILMWIGPDSIAWQRFADNCLDSQSSTERSFLEIHDESLPLTIDMVERNISSEPHEVQSFQVWQYGLCPVPLEFCRQIERPLNDFHRPLLKRQKIGLGTFGSVYRVKVKGHYFRGQDEELAMKVMSPKQDRTEIEWATAEWLFQQPMSHKHIMTALASLQLPDRLYIFFPLANCNLREYMTKRETARPSNIETLMTKFRHIIGIAEALLHLQTNLKDPDGRKMVCIHEDLKAENILVVYGEEGQIKLQITDFGISSIKFEKPRSGTKGSKYFRRNDQFQSQSRSLRNAETRPALGDNLPHFAPEALHNKEVDARVDIWAFGTVFAEYLAWLFDGKDGLSRYERTRKGVRSFRKAPRGLPIRKIEIDQWFCNIIPQCNADDGQRLLFERSWALVAHGLLVCEREKRAEIGVVCDILVDIFNLGDDDVENWIDQSIASRDPVPTTADPPHGPNTQEPGEQMTELADPSCSPHSWWAWIFFLFGHRPTRSQRADDCEMGSLESSPLAKLFNAVYSGDMISFNAALEKVQYFELTHTDLEGTIATLFRGDKMLTSNHDYMIADLIKRGISTNPSDSADTLLHKASAFGLTETVRTLLTYSAWQTKLNDKNEGHPSPLRLAVSGRHDDVVAILLRAGADVHIPDDHHCTVLHYAVEYPNRTAVEILSSQHRELLKAQDIEGQTPLHRCAHLGTKPAVDSAKALLNEPVHGGEADKRSAVNVRDFSQHSPLFIVTNEIRSRHREEMVNLFLRHGANTTGEDLGHYAAEYGLVVR